MPMGEGDEKCCLINTLTSRAAAAVVFNEAGKEKDGRGARTREGGSTFFLSPPPFGRTHQGDQGDQGSSSSACSFWGQMTRRTGTHHGDISFKVHVGWKVYLITLFGILW